MPEINDKINIAEKNFQATISEVSKTDDTYLRKVQLNLAVKQNDLIYALKQNQSRGGK